MEELSRQHFEYVGENRKRRRRRILAAIGSMIALTVAALVFVVWIPSISRVQPIPALNRINTLDSKHIPRKGDNSRLILVGDVHGQANDLKRLLRKIKFDAENDHLVLLGDFITKGEDSLKVLDIAMKYGASCVRGNHEDEIVNMYSKYHRLPSPRVENSTRVIDYDDVKDCTGPYGRLSDDAKLVRQLTPRHMRYISACPLMLRLSDRPLVEDLHAIAVHAGLQWNVPLEEQDPDWVLTIRSFLPPDYSQPSDDDDGEEWFKKWKREQKKLKQEDRLRVYYGHAARYGIQLKKYSRGLDSGCVKGGDLSAAIIYQDKDGLFQEDFASVNC